MLVRIHFGQKDLGILGKEEFTGVFIGLWEKSKLEGVGQRVF